MVVGRVVLVVAAVVVGCWLVLGAGAVVVVGDWVVGGAVTGARVVRGTVVAGRAEVVGKTVVGPIPGAVETEGAPTPTWGAAAAVVVLTRQGRFPQAEWDTPPATWSPKISPIAPAAMVVVTHGWRPTW